MKKTGLYPQSWPLDPGGQDCAGQDYRFIILAKKQDYIPIILTGRGGVSSEERRWRMGRDIAGRKDRDGRMGGCESQIVGGVTTLRIGVSFFFFF